MQARHSTNTRSSHTVNIQKITGHPQKRVVRRHLGIPRAGGRLKDHKILQQFPETSYSLLLHLLQLSSGLLQPLLLLMLRMVLLTLPY